MGQMISNIWQLNALLSGIFVFLILILLIIFTILTMIIFPFRRKDDD